MPCFVSFGLFKIFDSVSLYLPPFHFNSLCLSVSLSVSLSLCLSLSLSVSVSLSLCLSLSLFPSLSLSLSLSSSHLYERMCLSVGWSVRLSVGQSVCHTRVEYLRNGSNLNERASGIRKYAIQRQVRGQFARTHLLSDLCSTCFQLTN